VWIRKNQILYFDLISYSCLMTLGEYSDRLQNGLPTVLGDFKRDLVIVESHDRILSLSNPNSQSINMMILYGMGCLPLPVHFTNVTHVVERLTLWENLRDINEKSITNRRQFPGSPRVGF